MGGDFDLNSLYPHLIMQYNISPETIVGMTEQSTSVDAMLDKSFDTDFLKTDNHTLSPNGALFSRKKHGFLPELLFKMYNERKVEKKLMLQAQQEYENTKNPELLKKISRHGNKQMALKIALNSRLWCNRKSILSILRYSYCRNSVTYGGQLSIRWIEKSLNKHLNELLQTNDVDYVLLLILTLFISRLTH